jgi:hypothetical protein
VRRARAAAGGLVLPLALVLVVGAAGPTPGAEARPRGHTCGFGPHASWHVVSHRHGVSCALAQRILLRLRAGRDTIPMACGAPRSVYGWRVENTDRAWELTTNRYTKSGVSFTYAREQRGFRIWCPPENGDAGGYGATS